MENKAKEEIISGTPKNLPITGLTLFVCLLVFFLHPKIIRARELRNVWIIDLKLEFPHNDDHVIRFQQYRKYNRDKNVIKDRVITLVNAVDAVSYFQFYFSFPSRKSFLSLSFIRKK